MTRYSHLSSAKTDYYLSIVELTSYIVHPMYLFVSRLSDQQVWPFSALRDQKTIFRYRLNKEVTNFKYNESLFFGIPPKKSSLEVFKHGQLSIGDLLDGRPVGLRVVVKVLCVAVIAHLCRGKIYMCRTI